MIDFSKRISSTEKIKKKNPIDIYESLDRKSEAGPLRPCQERVLSKWYNSRKNDRDLIVKLHTGAGKTLIGLLMALSYINNDEGPAIYICPNIYLMQQACTEAQKFGIPFSIVSKDNEIPDSFYESKTILITYVQKVFNGLSIFGIGPRSTKVGCIILDDSHACIDSIINACTISVNHDSPAYEVLRSMFELDLRLQGEGTYQDLINEHYDTIMEIPYWSWSEKIADVTAVLSKQNDDTRVKFAWEILKNQLHNCYAYISAEKIEISPICLPINQFGIFENAPHRILMSATTQEDTFFIKGFKFSNDAILNPLVDEQYTWSGEKMVLIPEMICDDIDADEIRSKLLHATHLFGIAVLTPSFAKSKKYEELGAVLGNAEGSSMYASLKSFKENYNNQTIVLANRYDGVDLPDETCRILIIDSVPYYDLLADKYEGYCRANSKITKIKTIQKIEQGLGRSVRGEKDYSVILVFGSDLIKCVRSSENRKLFSTQTQKQLQIGFDIIEMSKEDVEDTTESSLQLLFSTIGQCIERNEGWKAYYSQRMNEIDNSINSDEELYSILQIERAADEAALLQNYSRGCELIQQIIDKCHDSWDMGWYLQRMARYKYFISKNESNTLQIAAFKRNQQLLKPISGIEYGKIIYPKNTNRIRLIKDYLHRFSNYEDFIIHIEAMLSDMSFGRESEKFESSVAELGRLLGFISQRPDKEIRKGYDDLWCCSSNKYVAFECKNEVLENRPSIKKSEAGQMEEHCAWFESEYGHTVDVINIMIIPTRQLASDAYFSHEVLIMRKGKLNSLQKTIRSFCKEFSDLDFASLSDETITTALIANKLHNEDFIKDYTESPYQKQN